MTTHDDPAAMLRAAVGHHQAGRLAEAERLYREVLRRNPNDVNATRFLGRLAHQAGHHDAAMQILTRAAALAPASAEVALELAAVCIAARQTSRAVEGYHQALRLRPDWAEAWLDLAKAHELNDDLPAARAAIE